MSRVLQIAIETLFPPSCLLCDAPTVQQGGLCGPCLAEAPQISGPVCDSCGVPILDAADAAPSATQRCQACTTIARPWRQGRAAFLYTGTARALVLKLKHADRPEIAAACGGWLAQASADLLPPGAVIVPVPIHWRRHLRRKYNQAARLAQALGEVTGHPVLLRALERPGATPSLDRRGLAERFRLLDGAIAATGPEAEQLRDARVLLVDDVMTTGATLAAAAEACRTAGAARVDMVVLARVAQEDGAGVPPWKSQDSVSISLPFRQRYCQTKFTL